jgi:hypothetical protein
MKTFALALCALFLAVGAAPMALAQDSSNQSPAPASAPSDNAASPSTEAAPKAPEAKTPDTNLNIDIKARTETKGSDDSAAASPRTGGDVQRTGFFGLSPAAAIIVSVAVLLVVVLAIVAMTNSSGGGTTYIDNTDRRV